MNNQRRGIILLILLLLGSSGLFACQQSATDALPVAEIETAVTEAITSRQADAVLAEGHIVPLRFTAVSYAVGGRAAEILVQEGQTIEAGEALVRLEASEHEIALAQADSGVAQAQANVDAANAQLQATHTGVSVAVNEATAAEAQLALLKAGPLPEEIAAAESEIAAATAAINQAAGNRDVAISGPSAAAIQAAEARVAAAEEEAYILREAHETLMHNEIYGDPEERARVASQLAQANLAAEQAALSELLAGPSAAQQSAAYGAVAVAMAQRDAAQAQLDLLLAGPKEEQITIAEVAVTQAQLAVTQAENSVLQAEAAVAQAEAALAQAEAARDAAQLALDEMTLYAPYGGILTSLDVQQGDLVLPNTPILTVADLSGWQVETADLTELDVVSVSIGSPVVIQVDALPDEELTGTVVAIDPTSTLNQGDVTYCVTIRLDEETELPLRWGMTTAVDIDTSS